MKKAIILNLLILACDSMWAQEESDVRVRANSQVVMVPSPQSTVDKKTRLKTVEWNSTENNSWHENIGILEHVPTIEGIESIFPDLTHFKEEIGYTPIIWQLTDEGNNTVLHCFLQMNADVVTNIWLGNAESVILDKQTGILYQAYATVPAQCYNKVFGVKGKEGTVLDLQIVFPLLPENAHDLAIYGVPAWLMRGREVKSNADGRLNTYDTEPDFHTPYMVKDSVNYDKNSSDSWAVYKNAHLIKPIPENTMALWRTPEATYLAIATEQNWFREYHGRGGKTILLDQQGHQYKCRGVVDYPNDRLFWLEGYPGDYFAVVLIFDPLPMNVESFTYVVPEGEPFSAWGANWSGEVITDLNVQDLRQNQQLFEYYPRRVVKQPTNFMYSTDKYYSIVNKSTGAKLGVSFDYNIHASAYRESAPSGRGPNGIKINDAKAFRFKFIPIAAADTCTADATGKDCYIVNEDMFALEDGSETSEGQWLIFRYLDKRNTFQQWTLYEKDGTVTIINKATGRCVDLAGGETKEGAAIFSYDIRSTLGRLPLGDDRRRLPKQEGKNDDPKSNANQKWVIEETE